MKDNTTEQKEEYASQIQRQESKIEILKQSTTQNLEKRQAMKKDLLESYHCIRKIRDEIPKRIKTGEIKEYLEMVIKNNFLESQNIQLLLNLQLQSRTIEDLKNIVSRQQKFIQENNIQVTDESIRTEINFFSPPGDTPSESSQVPDQKHPETNHKTEPRLEPTESKADIKDTESIEEMKDADIADDDDAQSMTKDAENLIAIVGSAIKNINEKLDSKPLSLINKGGKKPKEYPKPEKSDKGKDSKQSNLSISGNKISSNIKKVSKGKM
jgi:hypothetical protein